MISQYLNAAMEQAHYEIIDVIITVTVYVFYGKWEE